MRVVSTSLCGDTYLLTLDINDKITALSWQSDDALSGTPQNMRNHPKAWDDAERLLALNPTLIVFGPGQGQTAKPLLDKTGIAYVNLAWGEDFPSVENNYTILREALHIPEALEQDTKPHFRKNHSHQKPTLLYLSSAGGTAGPGTYLDAAIQAAGGQNIITKSGWHTPDPETIAGLTPDLIVTSFFKDGYASVNQAGLRNTVLRKKLETTPTINVPGKLWPCAGPGMYEATNIIAKAIGALKQ
ncbi:MAG: hypothetical protein COA69_02635 [Robiginitomaculum sp.]|nr:MAG: hypothetical protein COA69_02635 [Robiginitomaculum sp.]